MGSDGRPAPTAQAPDELRRGWKLLLTTCVGIACGSATLPIYSIGAFVAPLEEAFGWSRTQVQAATVFALGLGALSAPVIGQIIDRFGARRMALPGLVGVAMGFALAAVMSGALWQFYGAYAVIALLGAGTSPVTWTRVVAGGFEQRRGLALGIALSGTGVCAILAAPYAVWLVEAYGWRVAYLGLALLPLLLALPMSIRFIPWADTPAAAHPAQRDPVQTAPLSAPGLTTAQALRTYRFWVLAASIAAVYLGVTGVAPNLIPALTDNGFSPQAAAGAVSAYGVSIIVGRIAVGWLLDRFWAPGIAALVLTPSVLACIIFMSDSSYPAVLFAASLIGLAAGAELDLLSYLVTRYFGLRNYARTYGLLYAVVAVSAGTGPMAFAYLYDVTASYEVSFQIAAVLFGIGGTILLTLARYPGFEGSTQKAASVTVRA